MIRRRPPRRCRTPSRTPPASPTARWASAAARHSRRCAAGSGPRGLFSIHMSDDWRLRVDLKEHSIARQLGEQLQAGETEHELDATFHDRVVVSVDDNELFCYTGTQ